MADLIRTLDNLFLVLFAGAVGWILFGVGISCARGAF